ncbi:hypothetical protein KSS87_011771 [Heliosperma pusillum]|nr:hypothetical protein KSS87_011771 [Heliosperma pusillum]
MSVLGFDIGNENCVIAAVKQRGIDVLLNDESKRETPAVVSFGEKQRFLGSAGAACATMNPKSTISQIKRLIGHNFNHPDIQNDLRLLPFETSQADNSGILIHLQYLGERCTFTPVQILAMIFSHLKQTAEKNLDVAVSECVMGIPSYFTQLQKSLYLDAAKIAGLSPLRLMHDCTATALGYGIYRTDSSNLDSSCVVFVDVGHCDTQVAVASFKSGHMKILSHSFDCNLGARDFDEVLFCHFAAEFKEQYNIDVYSSARACIRLRAACEKLKKVLSANLEAPLHIECLIDEKDVKGFIRRDKFEELSSGLLERIVVPCKKALSDSGVKMIQSVELVGSGSRIPAIGRTLASFFSQEPRRTLNASECVARGCALQCAMLSPTFRVRDYEVEDTLPFSIGLKFADDIPIHSLRKAALFPKGHPIPSEKMIKFRVKGSTRQIEAYYVDEKELPSGVSSKISLSTISPLPSHIESGIVKSRACITLHGTITLSASLVGVGIQEETVRSNGEMPMERVEAEADYGSPHGGIRMGGEANHGSLYAGIGVEDTSSRPYNQASGNYDIPVIEKIFGGVDEAELSNAQEKEAELALQDCKVEQAKEKKNSLEAYVYEMRNKILSAYQAFATESEKGVISEKLQHTEDWLYEEGEDESANVYAETLHDIKKLVDPIESRYKDEEARERAARCFLDVIRKWQSLSLPASEREAVLAECARSEQWLQEKRQQQDSCPKNKDPVLWNLNSIIRPRGSPQQEDESYSDGRSNQDDMEED